jgi:hypothetical protein
MGWPYPSLDLVLYCTLAHAGTVTGMSNILEALARESSAVSVEDALVSVEDFDALLGIEQARAQPRTFRLVE